MKTITLDGRWKVRETSLACKGAAGLSRALKPGASWMSAQVPGEIHMDLMRAGRMDEPMAGLNAGRCRWPENHSWWFVKTFEATDSFRQHERQELIFEGLDLYAQVFLNGELLGETRNAFIPHLFEVRHKLKRKNTLAVRLTSGEELVDASLRPKGAERKKRLNFAGISSLRKPQFCYGWDWVAALPNIGIWRGVRLEGRSGVTLYGVSANTRVEASRVFLDIDAVVENLHPWSERPCELEIEIKPPHGKPIVRQLKLASPVGRSAVKCSVPIPNPELWWPNGMGGQPLYTLRINVTCNGRRSDRREMQIGLRTIALDRTPIAAGGSRFCINVNGRDVFCKGGNWVPADAILARVDKARYDSLVQQAKDANFTMLRVWGGGIYESPHLYDACDRAGILVWQDFMFACAKYPDDDPVFRDEIRKEAESVVSRLRHHPSIALWCGNNENVWGFADWWNPGKSIAEPGLTLGGSRLYNQVLPDVCRTLDPGRPYWPGSPCGGEKPNSQTDGDCHWWSEGSLSRDINKRVLHETYDNCRARFVSEFGVPGPCHIDSAREFLRTREPDRRSKAWKEHTNTFAHDTLDEGVRRHYADPDGLTAAQYILCGQMFQATMYAGCIESMRFRKNDPADDCQGALIWMFDDCWGEIGWTPLDYYGRRKPSYYWLKNAFTPVRAIVRRRGGSLVTRVVNDSLERCSAELHHGWLRLDGSDSRVHLKKINAGPGAMIEIARAPYEEENLDPCEWVYAAWLSIAGIAQAPSLWLLKPHRELHVTKPHLKVAVKGARIEVLSDVYCHGVHVADGGHDLFSDNYFDLLPRVPKIVQARGVLAQQAPEFRILDMKLDEVV